MSYLFKQSKYIKNKKKIYSFLQFKKEWYNWSIYLYDPVFFLFINRLMKKGNKKKIVSSFHNAFLSIKRITRMSPIIVFKKAIYNCQVFVETVPVFRRKKNKIRILFYKSKRYDGKQRIIYSLSLLMEHIKMCSVKMSFSDKLVLVLLNAFFKEGPVFNKVKEYHRCIKHYNRKKRFYIKNNKIVHSKFGKRIKIRIRRTRNTVKKVTFKRHLNKKKYGVYGLAYQLGKTNSK